MTGTPRVAGHRRRAVPPTPAITSRSWKQPSEHQLQGMQTRVHRMVMAPMFVEHLMFTVLGLVLRLSKKASHASAPGSSRRKA